MKRHAGATNAKEGKTGKGGGGGPFVAVWVFFMDGMAWAACNHAPNPNPEFQTMRWDHLMSSCVCVFSSSNDPALLVLIRERIV